MANNPYVNKVVKADGTTIMDITPTTAVANDVAQGKYFFTASGQLTLGTNQGGSGDGYVWQDGQGFVHLSDEEGTQTIVDPLSVTQNGTYTAATGHAYSPVTVNVSGGGGSEELLQKWTYDKLLVQDEGITLPAYSTSSQVLKAAADITPTITFDSSSYYYYWVMRGLIYPLYSATTKYYGKFDYGATVFLGELSAEPANAMKSLDGTVNLGAWSMLNTMTSSRIVYWSSAAAISSAAQSYGCYFSLAAQTLTSSTISFKSPSITYRGSGSYYNSTAWDETDDIRAQYIIEVYKVDKQEAPISDAVLFGAQFDKIMYAVNNNNADLT